MPSRYDSLDDAELARLSAAGDRSAFGAIVGRHGGRVYSLLRRRCRGSADADDLFQRSLLRAWTRIDRFDARKGTLAAWLLVVATRVACNAARERAWHGPGAEAAARPEEPAMEGAGRGVWEIVDRELSGDAGAALWLRYGEGLTPAQIGVALGRTPVGVRVLILRSLRRLRRALEARPARGPERPLGAMLGTAGAGPARSAP